MTATGAGERLFEAARAALAAAEAALSNVRAAGPTPRGPLRIVAPEILIEARFLLDIAGFCAAYPAVDVTLDFGNQADNPDRQAADVALRLEATAPASRTVRPLLATRMMVCAAPGVARPGSADLAARLWVGQPFRRPLAARRPSGEATTLAPARWVATNSAVAAKRLCLAGAGVALLPDFAVRTDIADGRLVDLLSGWQLPRFTLYLVLPRRAGRRDLARLFADFLTARVSALMRARGAQRF